MTSSSPPSRPPFFLYGTLLPGERNHPLIDGRVRAWTPAELPGALLFHGNGRPYPYPYALPDPAGAGTVRGEIAEIDPAVYDEVLVDLDRLEGYVPGGPADRYARVLRDIRTAGGTVSAWVYLATDRVVGELLASGVRIEGGDWRQREP